MMTNHLARIALVSSYILVNHTIRNILLFLLQLFAVFVTAQGRTNRAPNQQIQGGSFPGSPFADGFSFNGQLPGGFGPNGPFPNGEEFREKLMAKLCSNPTMAQTVLTKIQQLISTFQSNGSFAQVLADRANEVAYIQSSTNAALLSSDCTAFFTGLKNAKDADDTAMKARFQYYQIAATAMMQTIRSLIEGAGGY